MEKNGEEYRLEDASRPSFMMQESDTPQFTLDGDYEGEETDGSKANFGRSTSRIDKMRSKDIRKHAMKKKMSMDLGHVNVSI